MIEIPILVYLGLSLVASLALVVALIALIEKLSGVPLHILRHADYIDLKEADTRLQLVTTDLIAAELRLGNVKTFLAIQNDGTGEVIGYLHPNFLWISEKATRQNKADWETYTAAHKDADFDPNAPAPDPDAELSEWRKKHIG